MLPVGHVVEIPGVPSPVSGAINSPVIQPVPLTLRLLHVFKRQHRRVHKRVHVVVRSISNPTSPWLASGAFRCRK